MAIFSALFVLTLGTLFNIVVFDGIRETRIEVHGYFGSGETFVFRLNGTEYEQYFWVGQREGVGKPLLYLLAVHGILVPKESQCWFMHADSQYLCIGGGQDNKHAISIDSELKHGVSYQSHTFENRPLARTTDFVISFVEVWGFREHH